LVLWGGQFWPQPPFQAASRLKAGCGQNCPPHKASNLKQNRPNEANPNKSAQQHNLFVNVASFS
jgi:hypothetical protein